MKEYCKNYQNIENYDKAKADNFKGKQFSEEHKRKMSETAKLSEARKGRHWFNDGKINIFCFECPEEFTPGRLSNQNHYYHY